MMRGPSIAGIQFEGRDIVARQLQLGERVLLDREVGNPYDHNAVAVLRALDGKKLGYIPAGLAPRVAEVIDALDVNLSAVVTDLIDVDHPTCAPAVFIAFDLPEIVP